MNFKKILYIIIIISFVTLSIVLGFAYNASDNLELRLLEATDDIRPFREDFNYNFELVDDLFDDVSLIEFNYLNGVTSAIQTQLNAKQPLDTGLTSIAGLTTAVNKSIYTTALDTYATYTLTAFGRSILDDADEATFKATVNLEIGTDVLAEQTIGIADNNLLEVDGTPNSAEYARFTANGLEGRTEAEFKGDFNLEIGTDVQSYSENNALTTDKLSAFAATTSAELAGVISDETGTGALVFSDYPTLTSVSGPVRIIGQNGLLISSTNEQYTNKTMYFGCIHWDKNEQPVYFAVISNSETANSIRFGGSSSAGNAATEMRFETAADNTTVSGTTRMRITSTGLVRVESGDFRVDNNTNTDPHIYLTENEGVKWDIYNDHNDDALQVEANTTLRYEFGADGTAVADEAWNTFSPKITAIGRDLLAVAMEDAGKPVKPYDGIPVVKSDDELFDIVFVETIELAPLWADIDMQGNPKPLYFVALAEDVKIFRDRRPDEFKTQAEVDVEFEKYAKCPAKISIANAKYLDYLTGIIDEMQLKIDELELRIEKLENPIEPIK